MPHSRINGDGANATSLQGTDRLHTLEYVMAAMRAAGALSITLPAETRISNGSTLAEKLPYRADIDGLRAVAVLAVIAAHLPEKFLPSGFLGVDVFFVISGFVVTGSLMSQHHTGTVGYLYAGFLARRVKRLMPALTLCVAVTGAIVLLTDPFPRHSIQTGLAALFGFANMVLFVFELDYFSPSSVFNAFTHTWSLGVEEQFYVVFPMFAWLFFFRPQSGSFRHLAIATIIGGLISLAMFAMLYGDHQAAAFFLMPARIWELGVGALIFLGSRRLRDERLQELLGRIEPFALFALIACFLVPEEHAMPATIVAVALTAVLLASDGRSLAARLLRMRHVVYTGTISYSLYLWHWPIIALGPIVLPPAWRLSALYVVVTAIAAIASFHLVEKPLRYHEWTAYKLRNIGLGLSGNVVVAILLAIGLTRMDAVSGEDVAGVHPPPYVPILHNGKSHVLTCVLDGGSRQLQPDTVRNCTVPGQPGMPTIWTMGDSHSGHLQGMLFEVHERLGVGVHLVETPGWSFPFEPAKNFEPRRDLYERIYPLFEPGDIVMLSRLLISRSEPHEALEIRPWIYLTSLLAQDLVKRGVHVIVTGPPPIFPFNDIRECTLDDRAGCRVDRDEFAPLVEHVMELLARLEQDNPNVTIFEMFDAACPDGDRYCYPDNGSSYLFRDKDHFNSLGSRLMAEPFVDMLRTAEMLKPGQ